MHICGRAAKWKAMPLLFCATTLVVAANASPPEGAIILFDGQGKNLFVGMDGKGINWPIENGALVSTPNSRRSNNLVSRLHFRDAEIHVEFLLPDTGDGNSGVYLQGLYELQILGAVGKQSLTDGDMGAVYGLHPPLVNADLGPGQWQTLDIRFRAPRRGADGKLVSEGTMSAWLNGRQIQDGVRVGEKTSAYNPFVYDTTPYLAQIRARQQTSGVGPLLLQDHDNAVRFRNVWIKPLDDHAYLDDAAAKAGTGDDDHQRASRDQ